MFVPQIITDLIEIEIIKKLTTLVEYLTSDFINKFNIKEIFEGNRVEFEVNEFSLYDQFQSNISSINESLSNIHLINAFRGYNKRVTTFEEQNSNFSEIVQNYIQFEKKINMNDLWHPHEEFLIFEKKWFSEFGLNDLTIDKIKDLAYIVSFQKLGFDLNIADLGFGYSQLIPIILKILILSKTEFPLLMIEEPESHLHPNYQSKLAELFADAKKKFKINFLLETHSEYLIRKFQYLIAKGELSPDDVVIYYFGNPDDEDYIRQIKINKNGVLSGNFGPGFYDEAVQIISDIWDIEKAN